MFMTRCLVFKAITVFCCACHINILVVVVYNNYYFILYQNIKNYMHIYTCNYIFNTNI